MNLKSEALNLVRQNFQEVLAKRKHLRQVEDDLVEKLIDSLLNPLYSPKSLGLTYATIKYWESKGYLLLPVTKVDDEWRRYCLLEVFWIQILKKVVSMGCALDTIAPKLLYAYSRLQSYTLTIPLDSDVSGYVKDNIAGIRIEPLTTFLGHVFSIFTLRSKAVVYFTEKDCQFYFEKDLHNKDFINKIYQSVFTCGVSICISDIVYEFVLGEGQGSQNKLEIFNKQELEILQLLKKRELKEVIIKLQDGKPIHLELKEKFNITVDDASKRLKEFFISPYQEITAISNNGKTLYIERTTKQKINE